MMGEDEKEGRVQGPQVQESLHGLKLINALLSIALPDLAEGLVLVTALPHVLSVDHVIGCLLSFIPGICQL